MASKNNQRNPKKLIFGLLLIAAGIGIVIWGSSNLNSPNEPATLPSTNLRTAPNFNLERLDSPETFVQMSDFKDKPVVINLWASWCPFCVDELPDFAEIQSEYPDQVAFLMINRAEKPDAQKQFLNELPDFSIDSLIFLVDEADSYYQKTGGLAMPETLFINSNGKIVEHKRGPISIEELRSKVEELVK